MLSFENRPQWGSALIRKGRLKFEEEKKEEKKKKKNLCINIYNTSPIHGIVRLTI